VHQRYLRGEKRVLPDESLGAVNRVDEPKKLRVRLCLTGLFTVETVLGVGAENNLANRLLALDIGLCHGRHIGLRRDRKITGVVRPTDRGRLVGRCQSHLEMIRSILCVKTFHRRNYGRCCIEKQAPDLDSPPAPTYRPRMGNRLSKIYTRTGDDGTTGLGDGSRVAKDSARVEAYGTVDEANSAIGVVLAVDSIPGPVRDCLTEVQHDLFELGGELCIPGHSAVTEAFIDRLESDLDGFNDDLPMLKEFILPGGGPAAAACHLARTIVRRAERRVGTLAGIEDIRPEPGKYLNRLSDLLFVVARVLARAESGQEVLWNRAR
jgi:cob(I)alamin adenosyltransferase